MRGSISEICYDVFHTQFSFKFFPVAFLENRALDLMHGHLETKTL